MRSASGFDNVVVLEPKNLFYMTDFWGSGVGIVRPECTVVVTSFMEEKRLRETGKEVEIVTAYTQAEREDAAKRILARGKSVADKHDARLRFTVDEQVFTEARRKKDAEEAGRIMEASSRIDRIYELLERTIRPGKTERAIAAEVMKLATLEELSPLPAGGTLDPIAIASGENSTYPHAVLTDRKIKSGDMVTADIFFRYMGYCSDCTRTFAVGRVSRERREGYGAVLEAQLRGIECVRAGVTGSEVHESVVEVLREHSLDKYFLHSTGHGVGIDIHESPVLSRTSKDVLQSGDVVTVEPGIYLSGDYGVRIEDTLLVGTGADVLNKYTKELLVL